MKISTNTTAIVSYKIFINNKNGDLVEFADENNPRQMVFGNNSLIPGFVTNMNGLEPDNHFEFIIKPEESFGNYRDELIIDIPKTAFEVNGVVKEDILYLGNQISMKDNSGNTLQGTVMEINTVSIKMDFNHQFAGKSLYVTGIIHDVRNTTYDDVDVSGCGTGCGCGSNKKAETNSSCSHDYDEGCPTCGNPAELRGRGHGKCGCS